MPGSRPPPVERADDHGVARLQDLGEDRGWKILAFTQFTLPARARTLLTDRRTARKNLPVTLAGELCCLLRRLTVCNSHIDLGREIAENRFPRLLQRRCLQDVNGLRRKRGPGIRLAAPARETGHRPSTDRAPPKRSRCTRHTLGQRDVPGSISAFPPREDCALKEHLDQRRESFRYARLPRGDTHENNPPLRQHVLIQARARPRPGIAEEATSPEHPKCLRDERLDRAHVVAPKEAI